MKKQNIHTAQLLIGKHTNLIDYATKELQNVFCPKTQNNKACQICVICKQIENQQHHGAIWLNPEKKYTRESIQVIFDTISFKLEQNQKLFFVIQHADFLSDACSNSLLKSVEEPPDGYHFIFLAERLSQILPTIQSRCMIKSFYTEDINSLAENPLEENQIISIFKSNTQCPAHAFLKILDEEKPNEKETIHMLDIILKHWLKESKNALLQNNKKAHLTSLAKINILKKSLEYTPMPGSSKIFWRNLYLQFN